MIREALLYAPMPFALLSYMRAPRHADPAREIRTQLEQRATRFLETLRHTVFADPRHAYHHMFHAAGCTFGDLVTIVEREGLEPALAALHRQGVFLTHDEFKGRTPIVRSGRHIPSAASSWNNPLVSGRLLGRSSGSSGASVCTSQSVAFMHYQEVHLDLIWREFDLSGRAHADLRPVLPCLRTFELALGATRLGHRVDRWFPAGKAARYATCYRAVTNAMVATVNLAGGAMPYPEALAPSDFRPVASWIAGKREQGTSCAVTGLVSPTVGVASAALDHDLDIRGTFFSGGGEALTPAKRAVVQAAGAEIYSRYHITEIGDIGHACRQMRTGNSVHLYREAVAVVPYKRPAPLSGVEVDSLLFTTLLPSSPRVLINVEMEDAGVLAESHCDCVFTGAGLTTAIRDIASFGKLSGHGVTLVGTELVSVLEHRLPSLLGGRVGDYQLIERENNGRTEIVLYVSPRVRVTAGAARRCFLEELHRLFGGSLAAGIWTDAHAITAVIAEPIAGATGKILPLHLLGIPRN